MAHVTPTNNRPAVIRQTVAHGDSMALLLRILPASIFSIVLHVIMGLMFFLVTVRATSADLGPQDEVIESPIEEASAKQDLTNPDLGIDAEVATNYDTERLADVSVPGPALPDEVIGLSNAPEGPAQTIAPPAGFGNGQGGGIQSLTPGNANPFGLPGGYNGLLVQAGGFGARLASGATRERMLLEGGGNPVSEAAVGKGLDWLAIHQAPDGHWSLEGFTHHARDKYGPGGKPFTCNCSGVGQKHDIAGTAFGVLPFLGAGITHKPLTADKKPQRDYTKVVEASLKYLMLKQDKSSGMLGGDMYEHGLAAIALCEAYGLTADPGLKMSAQRALNYIITAQHEAGGWRYGPKQPGDTSVTGWQIMALRSGQMAGLNVPKPAIDGAGRFLDSVMSPTDYGYGYTGIGSTPTLSSVGLLCRQYLGWSPRKPELTNGVIKHLKPTPPAANNMYYSYYATQVMHHMGGQFWEEWNPKMRDALIKSQDQGKDVRRAHQIGSWDPKGDGHGGAWGRVGQTSLSLLTLEVYYRHLPLYHRVMGMKPEDK